MPETRRGYPPPGDASVSVASGLPRRPLLLTEHPAVHLKSLTLRGFKSFASSTTLQLEPGITCVVGPNGSGKSNVVDALAWVMGEQGAKSLRGGKMEDVIFAGTAGRPPLGRAEVMLTIDNSDGALPIDYTEVTISRTMFRNGGSDYAINGQPCRLLDVQELLADSGIGREMHVIVGQGQLDSILHATPEDRRGFVEEAAGVLKHRKRKEKALRKLESTEGNLMRLGDLTNEIRRQLKPLGRQAEVARKAVVVQADVRDARARLLADELVTVRTALEQELADETVLLQQRAETEQRLEAARAAEADLEGRLRDSLPLLSQAQDRWFGLAGMRERLQAVAALAAERIRNAQTEPEVPAGRDPQELLEQAREVREQEHVIDAQVVGDRAALEEALAARLAAEQAQQDEERRISALERASADRREGVARLQGQVNALRSRAAAAQEEVDRLTAARADAIARMERAERAFTALETQVAGLDAGEEGLDAEHEGAAAVLRDIDERLAKAREETEATERQRTALLARQEALELGLTRKDGAGALLAASEPVSGLLGSVAALLSVRPGYEAAVAAALGAAADAVAVEHLDAAVEAIVRLKDDDLGRAAILTGETSHDAAGPELPSDAQSAADLVECPEALRPALRGLLSGVAVVADLEEARRLVQRHPDLRAVTRDGDLVGADFAAGGSTSAPSLLEVQAALEETTEQLDTTAHTAQRLAFELNRLEQERHEAQRRVDIALAKLHESDAHLAAVAEELAQHGSQARSAKGEAERLAVAIETAEQARDEAVGGLAELEERAAAAAEAGESTDEDDRRAELAEMARAARTAETEARLALRTVEERARALAGRAESLERAARDEQQARARAIAHRDRIRREGEVARAVAHGARVVLARLESSLASAAEEREQVSVVRRSTEDELMQARGAMRELEGRL